MPRPKDGFSESLQQHIASVKACLQCWGNGLLQCSKDTPMKSSCEPRLQRMLMASMPSRRKMVPLKPAP